MLTREPKASSRTREDSGSQRYPYHARPGSSISECHRFIVYEESAQYCPPVRVKTVGVATVPVSWILDCLSHFELLALP